jgi:hypothetical protein
MLAQLQLLSMQTKSFWAYLTEHREETCFTPKYTTDFIHSLASFDKACDFAIYDVNKYLREVMEKLEVLDEIH